MIQHKYVLCEDCLVRVCELNVIIKSELEIKCNYHCYNCFLIKIIIELISLFQNIQKLCK